MQKKDGEVVLWQKKGMNREMKKRMKTTKEEEESRKKEDRCEGSVWEVGRRCEANLERVKMMSRLKGELMGKLLVSEEEEEEGNSSGFGSSSGLVLRKGAEREEAAMALMSKGRDWDKHCWSSRNIPGAGNSVVVADEGDSTTNDPSTTAEMEEVLAEETSVDRTRMAGDEAVFAGTLVGWGTPLMMEVVEMVDDCVDVKLVDGADVDGVDVGVGLLLMTVVVEDEGRHGQKAPSG